MISKELIADNKKKLLAEQKKLRGILNKENVKDGNGEFPGEFKPKFDELGSEEGENASEVESFGNNLSVTEELESRVKKIEWALARIEDGTYGKCAMGDEIEEERLRAEPAAETCMTHSK